jgi:hypothetical protein
MVLGGNLFPSRAGTHCLTDDGLSLPRRRRRRRAQRTTPIWPGSRSALAAVDVPPAVSGGTGLPLGRRCTPVVCQCVGDVGSSQHETRAVAARVSRLASWRGASTASRSRRARPPARTTRDRENNTAEEVHPLAKLDLVERRRHFQSGAGGCQTCGSMAEAAAAPWVRRRWLRRRSIRRLLVREGWLRET